MRSRPRSLKFVGRLALVGPLVLAACAGGSGGGTEVAVTASDTTCVPEKTDLPAGKLTFVVKNDGRDVTEMYVLAEGDKVKSEVENIGPGTSRELSLDLTAGDYTLQCKPGQKGDGIRTPIKVSGEGGTASVSGQREVEIEAVEYAFEGLDTFTIKKGETVDLEMINKGAEEHEMEVFGPDGEDLGEVGPTKPGAEGIVTVKFERAGAYQLKCGITDHEAKGMVAELVVV